MKKDLPIYDIKLTDDTQGVGFISLVDEPAIGVDWIKLAKVTIKEPKVVKSIMAKKAPKSIMAKKALGTLDGSGCFGCPPNGDGTKANGEPDARCKGDGSGKTGAGKGGSKGGSKVSDASKLDNDVKNTIKNAEPKYIGSVTIAGIDSSKVESTLKVFENNGFTVVPWSNNKGYNIEKEGVGRVARLNNAFRMPDDKDGNHVWDKTRWSFEYGYGPKGKSLVDELVNK